MRLLAMKWVDGVVQLLAARSVLRPVRSWAKMPVTVHDHVKRYVGMTTSKEIVVTTVMKTGAIVGIHVMKIDEMIAHQDVKSAINS